MIYRMAPPPPGHDRPRATVRYATERYDDILWENDRTAHRIYGPALEQYEPPSTSGIDAWGKSVRYPFMTRQLRTGDQHAYHGEGVDYYNVKTYRGNSAAMKGVNGGEVDGAVIYHYYYFGDQAKTGENSGNVAMHYFRNGDPGAFVSVSGGGVLASSKHPKEAQAFLKWITGKGGQAVLREGNSFEYAVANGEASNPKLEPLDKLQAPVIDPSALDSKKVTELMTAAGLL